MRSALAIAALAIGSVPAVLASPLAGSDAHSKVVAADTSLSAKTKVTATKPAEVLVTTLSEALNSAQDKDEQMDVVEPPPMFDPPEPRPGSIFVTEDGKVIESLPKPPAISLTRPEVLSPFEGSKLHPHDTPYPPDIFDYQLDAALYPSPLWHVATVFGALAILLSVATLLVCSVERTVAGYWRRRRMQHHALHRDAWMEEAIIEKMVPRRKSFSAVTGAKMF